MSKIEYEYLVSIKMALIMANFGLTYEIIRISSHTKGIRGTFSKSRSPCGQGANTIFMVTNV